MTRVEMIIGGFGGQGTLLAGAVLGKAAVYDGKKAVQTRSYGAEARGGAARSEIIVADEEIDYQMVIEADVLIAMSQLAFDRYISKVKSNGIVIVDEDIVKPKHTLSKEFEILKIPATRIASKELKQPIVANMIMVGVLIALTKIVTNKSLIKSIEDSVPKETKKINIEALKKGLELAE
ncbi:MAG: 2-oxoacid:acceptor oxidoreductase family protein [Candidatus Bathyarchaeota archaeon]|nr:2-oxoacid:acceptor oxidoreductase family protein [Candidatus Bathyarchaeota archaeon]MDH5745369.1 2-oxoacid:acceptor oxidoreductase family protein [Candidatus Bathyarchaeota archaeon]